MLNPLSFLTQPMIRDFRAMLIVLSFVLASRVGATEAPCHYPQCFPGSTVLASYSFRGEETKLTVHDLGKLDDVELVLIEVSSPGYAEMGDLLEGYLVKNTSGTGIHFERLSPSGGLPKMQFTGDLAATPTVQVELTSGGATFVLAPDKNRSHKSDSSRIMAKYHGQQTEKDFARELDEGRQALAGTMGEVNKSCGTSLTWSVTTGAFNFRGKDSTIDGQDLKYRCTELLNVLSNPICADANIKLKVKRDLREVECHFVPSGKSSMTIQKNKLVITASMSAARDGKGSFDPLGFFEQKFGKPVRK